MSSEFKFSHQNGSKQWTLQKSLAVIEQTAINSEASVNNPFEVTEMGNKLRRLWKMLLQTQFHGPSLSVWIVSVYTWMCLLPHMQITH